MESIYEEYQNGLPMEDIIREIWDMVRGAVPAEEIGKLAENLKNFNLTQGNLRCRLINYQANEETLKDQVFRRVSDLALVLEIARKAYTGGLLDGVKVVGVIRLEALRDQYEWDEVME